jgi:hypothetical protein
MKTTIVQRDIPKTSKFQCALCVIIQFQLLKECLLIPQYQLILIGIARVIPQLLNEIRFMRTDVPLKNANKKK